MSGRYAACYARRNEPLNQIAALEYRHQHGYLTAWPHLIAALPEAKRFFEGKKLRLKEIAKLTFAFDPEATLTIPIGPDWHPVYSKQQYELFKDELAALIQARLNPLTEVQA